MAAAFLSGAAFEADDEDRWVALGELDVVLVHFAEAFQRRSRA